MNNALLLSAEAWAEKTFGDVRLGDKRRTERAIRIATKMATESDVSLPRMMKSKAELEAAYRLLETPDVTYEALIRPHIQQTREQAQSQRRVLLIQDTTDLKYSQHPKTRGLGPLKNQQQHGMLLQTVLAVEAKHVLGIMHQEPFLRKLAPKQETRAERLARERESQVWERSVQCIGCPPEGVEWINVGDRGSNIFTFFETCLARGLHFLVRVAQDRCVEAEEDEDPEQIGRLKERIRALPAFETKAFDLPATADRAARTATLSIAWQAVNIEPPQKGASITGKPVAAWVLRVWEETAPEGVEPLEWILLTSVPIHTVEQAWERVDWYRARWIVEDYHQCLKSGCSIEKRLLQTYDGLRRLLGLLAPQAVRLLQLRALSRANPELPASQTMPKEVVQVVAHLVNTDASSLSTKQCWYAIAAQGGYLGRKGDGPPGWKTLWYGWLYIQTLLKGIRLASDLPPFQ